MSDSVFPVPRTAGAIGWSISEDEWGYMFAIFTSLSEEDMDFCRNQPTARVWPTKIREVSRISLQLLYVLGGPYENLYNDQRTMNERRADQPFV